MTPVCIVPREYQLEAVRQMRARIAKGIRRLLLVLATGGGKTVVAAHIIANAILKGKRVLFLAHRRELIFQTCRKLVELGVPPDQITFLLGSEKLIPLNDGTPRAILRNPNAPVIVASIDTYRNRQCAPVDLLFIDEAHRALSPSYASAIERNPNAVVLGLTATPWGPGGKGLGGAFQDIMPIATPQKLIDEGFLVCPRVLGTPIKLDLSKVKMRGGDYDESDLEAAVGKKEIVGNLVEHWLKYANGRRTVGFAVSVKHSKDLTAVFVAAGVAAEHLDGETDGVTRAAILARLASGETRVVWNCGVLCLDEETEILTSKGWRGIDTIRKTDLVANWDKGVVTFERPTAIVKRARMPEEQMVVARGERINLRVTEGHGMLYRTTADGAFLKAPARELVGRSLQLPVSGHAYHDVDAAPPHVTPAPGRRARLLTKTRYNLRALEAWPADDIEKEAARRVDRRLALRHKEPFELTLDECRFIGFWVGDGSRTKLQNGGVEHVVAQSFAYPKIIAWFEGVLLRMRVHFIARRVPPAAKSTHESMRWSLPLGTGGGSQEREGLFSIDPYLDKAGSSLLWGLNEKQFDAFVEGLWLADGDHRDGTPKPAKRALTIHGTSRPLFDTLMGIASVRGYGCTLSLGSNRKKNTAFKQDYLFRLRKKPSFFIGTDRLELENGWRDERVWCVRTRTKNIITRRGGKVLVMGNCEGWDMPSVKVCILARPTKSVVIFLQQCGRILRPFEGEEALILDHAGNVHAHGFPQDEREFSLESKKRRRGAGDDDGPPSKTCPECWAIVPSATRVCPNLDFEGNACGFEFPEPAGGGGLKQKEGELVEMKAVSLVEKKAYWLEICLQKRQQFKPARWATNAYRKKFNAFPPRSFPSADYDPNRVYTLEEKRAFFDGACGRVARTTQNPKQVLAQYKAKFNEWPPREWPVAVVRLEGDGIRPGLRMSSSHADDLARAELEREEIVEWEVA